VAVLVLAPLAIKDILAAHAATPYPVTFFGAWKSAEETDFQAILHYCDAHYGIKVTYQPYVADLATELATKVLSGNAPDVSSAPPWASIKLYVDDGSLRPLTFLNRARLRQQYGPTWLRLGTFSGTLYAIYMKTDMKSLVWYNPKKFAAARWAIPKTWKDMVALSRKMVKEGLYPWTFGAGGNPPSPWTLSDFFDNMYLQVAGTRKYDGLVAHTVKWTDPTVRQTFQAMNQIVGNTAMLAGGRSRSLSQDWRQAAAQMVSDPRAEFFSGATFVEAGLAGTLSTASAGRDYNAFAFPMYRAYRSEPVTVGVNGILMFHNTPGAQRLVQCLTDPKALAQWAKLGGYLSPNTAVPASAYHDPILRHINAILAASSKAGLVRVGADDLMPAEVGGSLAGCMPAELQKWFRNPSSYLARMSALESCAKRVYGH
jgi:ABC-type glycerol-3-phosphate transport system substrate-binding protein